MKGRNPNVGRHNVGAPIARSGTKPPNRTGRADRISPGARTNVKNRPITSATLMQSASQSSSANDYTKQAEQFMKQSPEPFRNNQPSANPNPLPPQDTGSGSGYKPFHGNRVSQAMPRSTPQTNPRGVGIQSGANSGMGRSTGIVVGAGKARTKRGGNPVPSFYGR